MSRTGAYEAKSDADGLEGLAKKLTADMRKSVRSLPWSEMAIALDRIASITEMEKSLPKESRDATLWECEELALRYLMEDGKVNVLLRALHETLRQQWKLAGTHVDVADDHVELMAKFERGALVTLGNAWAHPEALQTTDLPLLLLVLGELMEHAAAGDRLYPSGWPLGKTGHVLGLHCLLAVCERFDDIDEDRAVGLILEHKLVPRTCVHLQKHADLMDAADVMAGAEAISRVCDAEDFKTNPDAFVESPGDLRAVVELGEVLKPHVSDYSARRKVRALLDFIRRCGRRARK